MCAAIFIVVASIANSYVRETQLQSWMAAVPLTQIHEAQTFSTADAPYFLGHARHIKRDESPSSLNGKRAYPNYLKTKSQQSKNEPLNKRPLLSILVARIASSDQPASLVVAGNRLLITTAALTVLAISICFGAAGYWTLGAVAGLGGGLNAAYLVRSSIGRIDTDQLNLGFLYLIFGLCLFAGRSSSKQGCIAWCVAAGSVANIFMWWYGKEELIVLAAVSLTWILATLQRKASIIFIGTALFIFISGIGFFNPLGTAYLQETFINSNFIFPNSLNTVSEIQKVSIFQIVNYATGSMEMGIVCLTGLLLFFIRHPLVAIAYGPLLLFSLLNFIVGNRAIFYSAPIMWFGAAFLMTTTARFIVASVSKSRYTPRRDKAATILAASVAMMVAWVNSPTDYVPRPSFPKPVLEGFASLKASADPTNSVVATWWDYGYASMFFNELPTFHDGGSQTTPSTYFVARAFLNPDQISTIGNLKFLSTKGHEGIAAESSLAGLQEKFGEAISAPSPDLYLVVTSQMAGWMSSISQIGNWDIERGEPIALRGNPNGPIVNYEPLNCRFGGYPRTLSCAGTALDLERGLINGSPLLAGWAHSQDGNTVRGKSFDHNGDFGVQIVQIGNRINLFLMHRQLFESSFNKLFYLGQIDHPSISLHYDNYPHIRIYKIDGEPAG